jgi:hypothetical protein
MMAAMLLRKGNKKKMYYDEVIEALMNLDRQTYPCEVGIPCPDFISGNQNTYCKNGNCLDAMVRLTRKMVREGH